MSQLDRLGLRENPFNKNIDQRYFYADKKRAQILESTEHLIEYSSNFQVIIGESGMGKSHLLETLANRIDNNWRVAKIAVAEQHDTLSLIQMVLDSFGVVTNEHVELLEALETQLAEINQLGFKPVLFVDNAQDLSLDSLRFLIQLSQQKQDEVPYINIVLFATTQVTEFLQSPELKGFRDVIHITTLENLDKEGVSGYLRHKMAVAGFDRETPFTPRIIDSIFGDSEGIPQKVDFYADKFLASSGKADNYIEPDNHSTPDINSEAVIENQAVDFKTEHENNIMDSLIDDLAEHKTDKAEAQLSRLTEKFEEIEQMGKQSSEHSFSEGDSDYNEELESNLHNDDLAESGLPKFVIPVAVIAILGIALVVINTVFDQAEQNSSQIEKEKIDLLPLELPPEKLLVKDAVVEEKTVETIAVEQTVIEEKIITRPEPENAQQSEFITEENTPEVAEIELIEATDLSSGMQEKPQAAQAVIEKADVPVKEVIIDKQPEPVVPLVSMAELSSVEPEPVIGSNNRQYITIIGKNLQKNTHLIVTWAGNKKEFSQMQTAKQWQYVNTNKIKLHLSTGITSQQWKVSVKNADGLQSSEISFDVVRPFISQMLIKGISPSPFIGSNKRQAVSINGEGFSKQTVIELRWDKNKKHFSSRLTPSQFEYISSKQIKLFIATGIKQRKWTVVAISPTGKTSKSSFLVSSKSVENKKLAQSTSDGAIKDESWLKQQPDTNYTIQLFGSHNKQSIDELIKKYNLKGDILRYTTQRNGADWYTMTYGNYKSKQMAEAVVTTLDPALAKTPWVRNFASIKDQISVPLTKKSVNAAKPQLSPTTQMVSSGTKNEAWIWTQNPADYTIQLIALSTESSIKDYMKKYIIQSKSAYFKTMRDGKALYVLIYGTYTDKNAAQQTSKQLSITIKDSKPWVRNFSVVHGMMNSH